MVCCIQNQISEDARESLYRQNVVHLVKTYSQTQLHVLVLRSRKAREKRTLGILTLCMTVCLNLCYVLMGTSKGQKGQRTT